MSAMAFPLSTMGYLRSTIADDLTMVYLLSIPRELRDMIAEAALTSSTGYLTLRQTPSIDSPNYNYILHEASPLSRTQLAPFGGLSFLQTNTQLYAESSHLLWKLNTLLISPYDLVKATPSTPKALIAATTPLQVRDPSFRAIQHLNLQIDILSVELWNKRALKHLLILARQGSLSSLILTLVDPEEPGLERETARVALEQNLETLEKLASEDGLKRRVELWTESEKHVVKCLGSVRGLEGVLEEVGRAFGAGVWVDGKLRTGMTGEEKRGLE